MTTLNTFTKQALELLNNSELNLVLWSDGLKAKIKQAHQQGTEFVITEEDKQGMVKVLEARLEETLDNRSDLKGVILVDLDNLFTVRVVDTVRNGKLSPRIAYASILGNSKYINESLYTNIEEGTNIPFTMSLVNDSLDYGRGRIWGDVPSKGVARAKDTNKLVVRVKEAMESMQGMIKLAKEDSAKHKAKVAESDKLEATLADLMPEGVTVEKVVKDKSVEFKVNLGKGYSDVTLGDVSFDGALTCRLTTYELRYAKYLRQDSPKRLTDMVNALLVLGS